MSQCEGLVNYSATLLNGDHEDRLSVMVCHGTNGKPPVADEVVSALQKVPAIANAAEKGLLILEPIRYTHVKRVTTCAIKRSIAQRNRHGSK